jgi:hypothetical protein|tara:strand:- start:1649 stop:2170 length:522 start_codon:yes stop_codon:yes gene_type:complete
MAISINGSGTITGVSVGGLPDGIVDSDMLASSAVTTAKISDNQITEAKLASDQQKGLAKAWAKFDGTLSDIGTGDNSFNIDDIDDVILGTYTIHFTTDMPSANYVITGMCANTADNFSSEIAGDARGAVALCVSGHTAPSADSFKIEARYGSSATSAGDVTDMNEIYVAVFGD